jgi:5-methylcytosine-specific restriction endonuclease McrBC regulatory subunit McrC
VLRFCRLFLEGSGLSENAGEATTSAFFMPMWRVFERGVGAALRRAGLTIHTGPEYGDRFDHVAGTPERAIILKPDIVAGVRSSPDFVIDTKWSRPTVLRHGVSRFKNDHVYQLATYCTALGCDGMLVYPRFDEDIDVTYRFGGRSITLRTVDLTELDLAALETLAASVKDE